MSRSTSVRPRRAARLGVLAASTLLTLTVAACGSSTPSGPDPAAAPAAGAAFPVSIEHKYGATEVKAEPKRVVVVGLTEQDALLALGVVPVATTTWLGKFPGEIGPWASAKLNGAALPEVLTSTDGPPLEKVASLRPDLIVGLYSNLSQEQYTKLSQIAPTLAQPKAFDDYGIPWQETTKTLGKALGKTAQADQIVADVEARFTKVRQDNPKFVGATALMTSLYEGYFVFGSEDPRSRMLTSMGFKLPADLDAVIGDKFGANLSKERADLLDRDVLVWSVSGLTEGQATLSGDALYQNLKVAKEKREVLIDESGNYAQAVSFVSPLSIPYVLDRLVPQLNAAIDGDPNTAVTPVTE